MYLYHPPKPIVIPLSGESGFNLRQKAADYIRDNLNKRGAERGSEDQQGYGALAEITIRHFLGLQEMTADKHPISYDVLLPTNVKVDVKCRGGEQPFQEEYLGGEGEPREAKHNLFARQVYDKKLDTDIYLMTHLERPKGSKLPGTKKQRKWKLYVCGWVSKQRAAREGVYLPRGSLTERGIAGWFPYRGQEIEFYNKNLNGLTQLNDLLKITPNDIRIDRSKKGDLNLTSVDALRITYDLVGRGILNTKHIEYVKKQLGIKASIRPFLHPNQYHHLLQWLQENGQVEQEIINKAEKVLPVFRYEGI